MNIIYLLTNTNKTVGKRFYIGSKIECKVENYLGVMTIIDRNNKPYIGSSQSVEMKKDLEKGHVFEASILESSVSRDFVRKTEKFWLEKYSVASNEDYYNLTENTLSPKRSGNHIVNKYGELKNEYASSKSACSKRVNRAIKLGFKSYGDFIIHVQTELNKDLTLAQISRDLGCNRHSVGSTIKGVDLLKCYNEIVDNNSDLKKAVYNCFLHNASVHKTSELLKIELPTVIHYLEGYNPKRKAIDRIKITTGLSQIEITKSIIKLYLKGMSLKNIGFKLKLDPRTTQKYFDYYVKKRLDINDI